MHDTIETSRSSASPVQPPRGRHVRVTTIFTVFVVLGMLAYVADAAVGRGSGPELLRILGGTWWLILILTVPYLAARAVVWYELLNELGVEVPRRQLLLAFAAGEITKSLPAGVYVQNYLLGRLQHLGQRSLVRSTTATTATLGLEALLALPVALVIGLPGEPWFTWTLGGIVAAWVVLLLAVSALVRFRRHHIRPDAAAWRHRVLVAAAEFLAAGRELLTARTARALVPTAVYMAVYALEFGIIVRASGIEQIGPRAVLGVYAILILATILVPIPSELGVTEFTGLGALLAFGASRAPAAVVMLSFRILGTGAVVLVATIVVLVLRKELSVVDERTAGEAPAC